MIKSIVCAVDGSDHSDKAVDLACDLAARYGAKLSLLHVFMKGMTLSELQQFSDHAHLKDLVDQETEKLSQVVTATVGPYPAAYIPPPSVEVVARIAEVVLEDARQVAESKSVTDVVLATADGNPAEQIVEYASSVSADTIVMGNRGLGTLKGIFLGSTSHKVCHLSESTCITVK